MKDRRVRYTLDSIADSFARAETIAEQFAIESGFGEQAQEIALSVRGAVINAILHGNRYDPGKKVDLELERTADSLRATIRDEGAGFDPSKVPDPLAPDNLLKQSGRGIFLVRSYMDEVHFRKLDPGTEMVLIKRIGAAGAKEKA